MKTNIVELEGQNQQLKDDANDIHRRVALTIEDLVQLNERLEFRVLQAELECDQLKQNAQQLKDENAKWKKDLKNSAVLLEKLSQRNKEEKDRLDGELRDAKMNSEELKKDLFTKNDALHQIQTELDSYKQGLLHKKRMGPTNNLNYY